MIIVHNLHRIQVLMYRYLIFSINMTYYQQNIHQSLQDIIIFKSINVSSHIIIKTFIMIKYHSIIKCLN